MQFKGTIVSGDLEENTLTIEMDKPITLKVGEYVVIPIEEFKQHIIDARSDGRNDLRNNPFLGKSDEEYYNETFNK